MKNVFRHIIAPTIGTIIIYLLFRLESYIWDLRHGDNEEFREYADFAISDFFLIGVFLFLGLCIQLLLVRPIFDWLTRNNKMTRKNLTITGLIFSVATGVLVGLNIGSIELGLSDVLTSIGGSIVIFSIYYMTTFVTFKKLSD